MKSSPLRNVLAGLLCLQLQGERPPNYKNPAEPIEDIPWFQNTQSLVDGVLEGQEFEIQPEYERELNYAYITVPRWSDRRNFNDFLRVIPDYTHVTVHTPIHLVPAVNVWMMVSGVESFSVEGLMPSNSKRFDLWTQDRLEFVSSDGEALAILPSAPNGTLDYYNDPALWLNRRSRAMRSLVMTRIAFEDVNTAEASFLFEGGDLYFDIGPDGGPIAFFGNGSARQDIALNTSSVKIVPIEGRAVGRIVPDGLSFEERVKKDLGSQVEVQILGGNEDGTPFSFHIDQGVLFLDDGVVVIPRYIGVPEDDGEGLKLKVLMESYRSTLLGLGYEIKDLELAYESYIKKDPEGNFAIQSPINGIPYINRDASAKSIIFPVFEEDVPAGRWDSSALLEKQDLSGNSLIAYNTYEELGLTVQPVRDFSASEHGNVHCMVLVVDYPIVDIDVPVSVYRD